EPAQQRQKEQIHPVAHLRHQHPPRQVVHLAHRADHLALPHDLDVDPPRRAVVAGPLALERHLVRRLQLLRQPLVEHLQLRDPAPARAPPPPAAPPPPPRLFRPPPRPASRLNSFPHPPSTSPGPPAW